VSGVQEPRFIGILSDLANEQQMGRITKALAPLM